MVAEYSKPLPNPLHHEASLPFWEGAARGELMMPHCKMCDRLFFYPREVCPVCLSANIDWMTVSGRGRVYSFTIIHQPAHPAFREDTPYVYAIIQLDEGPRMISNLVECATDDARIGMPVVAVFDAVTPEVTLVKFRPG